MIKDLENVLVGLGVFVYGMPFVFIGIGKAYVAWVGLKKTGESHFFNAIA